MINFSPYRIEIFALLACVGLLGLVFELVRRHQIKEKYSFLWILTCVSLFVLTVKRSWLESLSFTIGVYYPPSALFLVLSFFMILILVHYSIVLSKLLMQNQKLAQRLALLETKLHQHQQQQIIDQNKYKDENTKAS